MVLISKLSGFTMDVGVEAKLEFYSHANTYMIGTGFILLNNLYMECKFCPCSSDYDPNIVILVNAVTDYDHPDGKNSILGVNQDLNILDEYRGLLFLPQISYNGLIVE